MSESSSVGQLDSLQATLVVPWDHSSHADRALLGGKAFNLHQLAQAGFPVPPWFTLSTIAFDSALGDEVRETIRGHLEVLDFAQPEQVRHVSRILSDLIAGLALTPDFCDQVLAAYQRLAAEPGFVAVRSSAVEEDAAGHSFAGQHDTFLFIKGQDELFRAVRACWASLYSERSLHYRHQHGHSLADVRIAVVVQQMVAGEVSGVMFTANPLNGKRRETVISATYGLGEGLVSGELDADNWILERTTRQISPTLANKTQQIVLDAARGVGTTRASVPVERQSVPSLTDQELWALADLGVRLEEQFGAPQDVEWTVKDGAFVLLQARPITALPHEPQGKPNLFDNSNVSENYSGVTTPLTFTFARRAYEVSYLQLAETFGFYKQDIARCMPLLQNMIGLIQGRIYYNLGNWYEMMAYFPGYQVLRKYFALGIGLRSGEGGPQESRAGAAWKLFRPVSRMGKHFINWDREVNEFASDFGRIYAGMACRPFSQLGIDALVDTYLELERDLLACWRAPMVNDFFATIFYGLLKQLIVRWKLDENGSLQNDLLCGEGGIISTEPTRYLLGLAESAWSTPSLRSILEETPADQVLDRLRASGAHPSFLQRLDEYLDRFGYRCIGELRLESVPLTEDPSFLFVSIANYLRSAERDGKDVLDFQQIEARERGIRLRAEAHVAQRLRGRPLDLAVFNWVLRNARKAVKNRENMRFNRTQAFGLVREIFGMIGRKLCERGLLAHPRDVYYLNLDEIIGWAQGRSTCTDLQGLANLRQAEFARYPDEIPDDRFETLGPVYLDNPFRSAPVGHPDTSDVLHGTSCCPGTVKGIARVIRQGGDMRLNGEILVAERTDPGWTPLFPSASALLIERGSMLSHSAIVAREMGLPTIVGIAGLMRRVSDGQYLEIDAREGLVYLDRQP